MKNNEQLIALAAGTHLELSPEQMVYTAGEAGFNSVGIRIEPGINWCGSSVARVRSLLNTYHLTLLDVEVIRLKSDGKPHKDHHQIIDIAGELGANNVLVVSDEPDLTVTKHLYADLCRRAEDAGVRAVLEFMFCTQIKTLDDALDVIHDVDHPSAGILVDALHLEGSGNKSEDLHGVDAYWLPYMQLCDAPARVQPITDVNEYLDLARNGRTMPGEGSLPLVELMEALPPNIPICVEVLSQHYRETYPDPVERARVIRECTDIFIQNL